jgi:DNA-binding beta-propeller fold protein YncE
MPYSLRLSTPIYVLLQLIFTQSIHAQDLTNKTAFQLMETGLITEGVAYDASAGTFYVGSVHKRKIISYNQQVGEKSFSLPSDSLWGVFGMKVDDVRGILWACSSTLPQAIGSTASIDGRTSLVSYDLKTNRLLNTYTVPSDGKPHLFGDLTVAKNGTVYSTDSRTPSLYRLVAGEQTVTRFLTDSLFYSLQGLALSDDEQTLYVADYRRGPLAINLATKQVTKLTWPAGADLSGIDGMYYYKNSLIAIQNRSKPYKVIRLYLAQTAKVIDRVDTLIAGHPLMTEPTLGVVAGSQFYFIANSQWDAFDNAGKPVANYPAQKPTILVLALD